MPEHRPEVNGQRLVLEGGSIDTNGAGLLLTTEECLLSEVQQRNPGVSREQLDHAFAKHLGIEKTLWLHRGCAGDDTHGHVDDVTRFVAENTILTRRRAKHRRREPPATRREPRPPPLRPQLGR